VEGVIQKEAEGAKWYWSGVRQLIPKELGFKGRKRGVRQRIHLT
jgi:CRISPR-associated protein, Cas1 family